MRSEGLPDAHPAVSSRAAWVIVSIMTALVVLALLGVVWGFVRQYRIYMGGRAQPAAATSAPAAVLTLAPGAHIVSAATDAGKLVLHVKTQAGAEVDIIDLQSGQLTGRVREQGP